eukprot:3673394-Pleurochrysis_carterae.AAC.2
MQPFLHADVTGDLGRCVEENALQQPPAAAESRRRHVMNSEYVEKAASVSLGEVAPAEALLERVKHLVALAGHACRLPLVQARKRRRRDSALVREFVQRGEGRQAELLGLKSAQRQENPLRAKRGEIGGPCKRSQSL